MFFTQPDNLDKILIIHEKFVRTYHKKGFCTCTIFSVLIGNSVYKHCGFMQHELANWIVRVNFMAKPTAVPLKKKSFLLVIGQLVYINKQNYNLQLKSVMTVKTFYSKRNLSTLINIIGIIDLCSCYR